MGSLAKKILNSVASFTGADEQLVSTDLLKTICAKVGFEPSSVLDVIDKKMKTEEDKLAQARIVRDKKINEYTQQAAEEGKQTVWQQKQDVGKAKVAEDIKRSSNMLASIDSQQEYPKPPNPLEEKSKCINDMTSFYERLPAE